MKMQRQGRLPWLPNNAWQGWTR